MLPHAPDNCINDCYYECMSERTETIMCKRFFRFPSNFAGVLKLECLEQSDLSRSIRCPPYQHDPEILPIITPYLPSKASFCSAHRNGIQMNRATTPTFTHLSTLQQLLLYITGSPNRPKFFYRGNWKTLSSTFSWTNLGRLPQATKLQSQNNLISTALSTSNAKPNFTFEAELGSGTCVQSSTTCHTFFVLTFWRNEKKF